MLDISPSLMEAAGAIVDVSHLLSDLYISPHEKSWAISASLMDAPVLIRINSAGFLYTMF